MSTKFRHKYHDPLMMPEYLQQIPGLRVDYQFCWIEGSPDALEAGGAVVDDLCKAIYKDLQLPRMEQLRDYQQDAVEWILNTCNQYKGAILADDMGLGKTRTAIAATLNIPKLWSTLIVAPASVSHQWKEELKVFGKPATILGPKNTHKKEWFELEHGESGGTFIVSPNLSEKALDSFTIPPTALILDEPHMYLRGRTNKWGWALANHIHNINYRIACTGTPMYNTPRDLWFLLFLLFGMRFGKAKEFDARYCGGKQGTYGWENSGATNLPELKKRLSHYMLRRTLEDVKLELPPITTSFRWVQSTTEAQAAMLQSHGSAQGVDGALDKCLTAKIDETVETAIACAGPVVVWTYHPHHANAIAQLMEQSGKQCVSIHGGMSVENRHFVIKQAALNQWSIAATIDSCGTGVNMQGVASTAIFHTIQRIPKKTHQAMKRLHRGGQKHPVHCIFIAMRDAMDEIVVDTVIKKLDYWNALMGEDDVESTVGGAVRSNKESEDAILRAIYEEMQ